MDSVSVTTKGQIVIPADLRKKYGIHKGTRVRVLDVDGEIVVRPLLEDPVRQGRGCLKGGKSLLKALVEDRVMEARQ